MNQNNRNPITWVPTVYFAMGLPFVVLNMVSVLMFKGLGIGDAQIALWTSLIMLPWTLKSVPRNVQDEEVFRSIDANGYRSRFCSGSFGSTTTVLLRCLHSFDGYDCL